MVDVVITSSLVSLLFETSIIYIIVLGEGHGTGPSHPVAQKVMREMILGGGGSSGSTPTPSPSG